MLVRVDLARPVCLAFLCSWLLVSCHGSSGGGSGLELVDRDEMGDRGPTEQPEPAPEPPDPQPEPPDPQDDPLPPTGNDTLAEGSRILSAQTSLAEQPSRLEVAIPADAQVKQVLLYWDSPSETADDVLLAGGIAVRGAQIREGQNTSRPVFRTELTELGLLKPGANSLELSGLDLGSEGSAGASLIVVVDDGSGLADLKIQDGSSGRSGEELGADGGLTHMFPLAPASLPVETDVALLVSDGGAGELYDVVVEADEEELFRGTLQPGSNYWAEALNSLQVPAGAEALRVTASPRGGGAGDLWVISTIEQSCTGAIRGQIREDGSGESFADVEVTLEGSEDTLVTTQTLADGTYAFTGLCEGEYTVRIDPEAIPENFRRTNCTDDATEEEPRCDFFTNVVLETNDAQKEAADFEFTGPCDGLIGDFVWNDLDGNGIATPDEPGLFCVTMLLSVSGSDVIVEETVTDADGFYSFEGLCSDEYSVRVKEETLPPAFTASPCEAANDSTRDSSCSPTVVLGTDDAVLVTHDFGFMSPCSGEVRGQVARASSGEGDPGGEAIEGVVIRILDGEGNLVAKVVSDPEGYSFRGLCAGEYRVEIESDSIPPTVMLGDCEVAGELVEDCSSIPVTLNGDGDVTVVDFPLESDCSSAIVGRVWNERSGDSFFGGGGIAEYGLEDITVVVRDADGEEVLAASSRALGMYRIAGLCAGSYSLEVDESTLPPEVTAGPCVDMVPPRLQLRQATCLPAPVGLALDDGETVRINVGVESPYDGRYLAVVFNDADGDGSLSEGESGIEGARVTLYNADGEKITTVTSRQSGSSNFDGLKEGQYILEVDESTVPEGYTQAVCAEDEGGDVESRCNRAHFQIPPSDDRQFVLFGYSPPTADEDGGEEEEESNDQDIEVPEDPELDEGDDTPDEPEAPGEPGEDEEEPAEPANGETEEPVDDENEQPDEPTEGEDPPAEPTSGEQPDVEESDVEEPEGESDGTDPDASEDPDSGEDSDTDEDPDATEEESGVDDGVDDGTESTST